MAPRKRACHTVNSYTTEPNFDIQPHSTFFNGNF